MRYFVRVKRSGQSVQQIGAQRKNSRHTRSVVSTQTLVLESFHEESSTKALYQVMQVLYLKRDRRKIEYRDR